MKLHSIIMIVALNLCALQAYPQLYTGLSGLLNTPSADMNEEGNAWIGCYFLNKHFTPGNATDRYGFVYEGEKYNTADFYLSVTPFRWIELGYTFTLQKTLAEGREKPRYNQKDRYFSIKLNPLREGRYHPAIAIGANDFLGSPTKRHAHGGSGAGYRGEPCLPVLPHCLQRQMGRRSRRHNLAPAVDTATACHSRIHGKRNQYRCRLPIVETPFPASNFAGWEIFLRRHLLPDESVLKNLEPVSQREKYITTLSN